MKAHFISNLLFIVVSAALIGANLLHREIAYRQSPSGTLYTYAMGNIEDYHQYMYMIKLGREGTVFFHNAFTEEDIPDVVLQPIYNISGMLTRPLHISLYDIYFGMHIISLILLFSAVYFLITRLFSGELPRIAATVWYFSSTGIWWFQNGLNSGLQKYYLPNFNFDVFFKYHVIPPHHNIATALFIAVLLLFNAKRKKIWIIAGAASFILGWIHPYILFVLLAVHAADVPLEWVLNRRIVTDSLWKIAILLVSTVSLISYYLYILLGMLRTEIGTKGITSYLPRAESTTAYLMSLGPMFVVSLMVFLYPKYIRKYKLRSLMLWAYVPVVLFYFPDFHLPVNTWRLFQSYQHIPLSLLSAFAVSHMTGLRRYQPAVTVICCVALFLYGLVMYTWSFRETLKPGPGLIYNVQIPHSVLDVFAFLRSHTPMHSVVLGGSVISNMIPEFTDNHVIIGHNGNNRNFLAKQHEIGVFLSGNIPPADVRAFLGKYRVAYIIFGIDAPEFAKTPYASLPFLREVYHSGFNFSVVQVL